MCVFEFKASCASEGFLFRVLCGDRGSSMGIRDIWIGLCSSEKASSARIYFAGSNL